MAPGSGRRLQPDWTLPVKSLRRRVQPAGRHRPAAAPVADRVVLRPARVPTGPRGPRGSPGRPRTPRRPRRRRRRPPGGRAPRRRRPSSVLSPGGVPPRCSQRTVTPAGAASGCSSSRAGDLDQRQPACRRRGLGEDAADRRQRRLVAGQHEPAGRPDAELAAPRRCRAGRRVPRPPPTPPPGRRRAGRSRSPPRRGRRPAGGPCSCAGRPRGRRPARRRGRPAPPAASAGRRRPRAAPAGSPSAPRPPPPPPCR